MEQIGTAKVTTTPEGQTTVALTPDYKQLHETFLRDAENHLNGLCSQTQDVMSEAVVQAHGVRSFLAPLNIACQTITNTEALQEFQKRLSDMTTKLAKFCDEHQPEEDGD